MTHRLLPIDAPYPADVAELLSHYPQVDGELLRLFRVFANSRRFLRKAVPNLLDRESPLSLMQREIVILRTTANLACEYEWGVHAAVFPAAAGLSDEQLRATVREKPEASCWDSEQQVLLRVVDALCRDGRTADALQRDFEARFDAEQQLEVIALCGTYHTVSYVANTARLAPEARSLRFPR